MNYEFAAVRVGKERNGNIIEIELDRLYCVVRNDN